MKIICKICKLYWIIYRESVSTTNPWDTRLLCTAMNQFPFNTLNLTDHNFISADLKSCHIYRGYIPIIHTPSKRSSWVRSRVRRVLAHIWFRPAHKSSVCFLVKPSNMSPKFFLCCQRKQKPTWNETFKFVHLICVLLYRNWCKLRKQQNKLLYM